MIVWFIEMILKILLLPVLLIAATPFILGFSFFGKEKYGVKLKKRYLKVTEFWSKYI